MSKRTMTLRVALERGACYEDDELNFSTRVAVFMLEQMKHNPDTWYTIAEVARHLDTGNVEVISTALSKLSQRGVVDRRYDEKVGMFTFRAISHKILDCPVSLLRRRVPHKLAPAPRQEGDQSERVTLPVVVNNSRDREVSCLDAITQVMDHFGLDGAARERLAGYLYDRHGPSEVVQNLVVEGLDEAAVERLARWGPPS